MKVKQEIKGYDPYIHEIFSRYEKVRSSGDYNMKVECIFASNAAGLSADEYWFVLENYEELAKIYK